MPNMDNTFTFDPQLPALPFLFDLDGVARLFNTEGGDRGQGSGIRGQCLWADLIPDP